MQIKGKIHEIGVTEQISDKFKKRKLILEYAENPQYPEFIKFEAVNDKCAVLDNFRTGQEVTVDFNLKGKAWEKGGKTSYFNSLVIWKINS